MTRRPKPDPIPYDPEPVRMMFEKQAAEERRFTRGFILIFGLVLVGFVAGIISAAVHDVRHRNDPPPPCATYASKLREYVPARCFADFNPDGGR